jgi:hypothetical protein
MAKRRRNWRPLPVATPVYINHEWKQEVDPKSTLPNYRASWVFLGGGILKQRKSYSVINETGLVNEN